MVPLVSWIAMTLDTFVTVLVSTHGCGLVRVVKHMCPVSDDGGRYAYDRQAVICRWNLKKLAEALSNCLSEDTAEEILKL